MWIVQCIGVLPFFLHRCWRSSSSPVHVSITKIPLVLRSLLNSSPLSKLWFHLATNFHTLPAFDISVNNRIRRAPLGPLSLEHVTSLSGWASTYILGGLQMVLLSLQAFPLLHWFLKPHLLHLLDRFDRFWPFWVETIAHVSLKVIWIVWNPLFPSQASSLTHIRTRSQLAHLILVCFRALHCRTLVQWHSWSCCPMLASPLGAVGQFFIIFVVQNMQTTKYRGFQLSTTDSPPLIPSPAPWNQSPLFPYLGSLYPSQ